MEFLEPVQGDIQKCNHCGSVFISDSSCECCGIQLHLDKLGKPTSQRSFWSLKDDYWSDLNPIAQCYNIFEPKKTAHLRKYQRALENRYKVLLEFFFIKSQFGELASEGKVKQEEKVLYLFELKALIQEMLDYGYKIDRMMELLEANVEKSQNIGVSSSLYHQIMFWISQRDQSSSKNSWDFFSKFLSYRIMGVLHTWKLALTFVCCFGLIKLALYLVAGVKL